MKLNEILHESLTPKERSPIDQLEQLVYEFHGPTLFVHMSDIEKIGMNPQSSYNTPLGIYTYPSSYLIEQSEELEKDKIVAPFAATRKYAHVLNQLGNVIDNSYNNLHDDLDKLILKYNFDEQAIYKWANSNVNSKPGKLGKLWYVTKEMADYLSEETGRNPIIIWNEIFRKGLGYDAVVDWGDGIIHDSEPTQAVHFDYQTIEHIETIVNSQERNIPSVQTFKQLFFNEEYEELLDLMHEKDIVIEKRDYPTIKDDFNDRIKKLRFKNPVKVQSWFNFIKDNRKEYNIFTRFYNNIREDCDTLEMFSGKAKEYIQTDNFDVDRVGEFLDYCRKLTKNNMSYYFTECGYELYETCLDLVDRYLDELEHNDEQIRDMMKGDFPEPNPIIDKDEL